MDAEIIDAENAGNNEQIKDTVLGDGTLVDNTSHAPVVVPAAPVILSGQATDDQIAQWKAENIRGVWGIIFSDKIGYFRKPSRDEMKSVATMGQTDPIGQIETLMNDSWLGGDKAILTDDDYFLGASSTYQDLVAIRTAELKKL